MATREMEFLRHQQARWMHKDAHRWIRQDAARYLKPGTDAASVFLCAEHKFNPSQPRVPAGSGRESGRWTSGGDAGAGAGNIVVPPMGNIDFGDLPTFSDLFSLFQIAPSEADIANVQLAGDPPTGDSFEFSSELPEVPSNDPPEIPQERPKTSAERTGYSRAVASWFGRNAGLAADIYAGSLNNIEWLRDYHDLIQAARDEPKTFEELQDGVGLRRPGYDDHHIVEQTWAERFGFSRSEIDDPSNLVSIPRLKHYQITGWYGTRNPDYDWLSPREYLSDKDWAERMRVGRRALILFEVLRP